MKLSGRKTVKVATTSAPMAAKAIAKASANTSANTWTKLAGGAGGGTAPSYEEIARRSYELYLARGGLDGHDVEDWLQAEADLRR